MKTLRLVFAVATFAVLNSSQPVMAANVDWIGTGIGAGANWSVAANWFNETTLLNVVPTAVDIAVFNSSNNTNSTIDAGFAGSVSGINITNTYTAMITNQLASLTLGAGGFSQANGTFDAGAGSTLRVSDSWSISGGIFIAHSGTVDFNGSSSQNLNSGGQNFNNLTHTGSASLTLVSSDLTVTGILSNIAFAGTLDANGHNVSAGTLSLAANFSAVTSNLMVGSGGLSQSGGIFTAPGLGKTFNDSGNFTLNAGFLIVPNGGSILANVQNHGGTIIAGEPGDPSGFTINGTYVQTATGVYNEQISSTANGFMDVAGSVALDGALDISLLNGFAPLNGTSFNILDAGSESGLLTISDPLFNGGSQQWVITSYHGGDGDDIVLTAEPATASVPTPEPGTMVLFSIGLLSMVGIVKNRKGSAAAP